MSCNPELMMVDRVGLILDTLPHPKIYFGNISQIREMLKVPNNSKIRDKDSLSSSDSLKGWRLMTEDEEVKYYLPPLMVKPQKYKLYTPNRYGEYRLTLFRKWKKGDKYPTESDRRYTGTVKDFKGDFNVSKSVISRWITSYIDSDTKQPIHTVKGWRIARLRKYG